MEEKKNENYKNKKQTKKIKYIHNWKKSSELKELIRHT
jgi:hypothetical protein